MGERINRKQIQNNFKQRRDVGGRSGMKEDLGPFSALYHTWDWWHAPVIREREREDWSLWPPWIMLQRQAGRHMVTWERAS